MRILHVLEALEGGTALHVRTLAERQARAGTEVAVVVPRRRVWGATDEALVEALGVLGAELFFVPMHRSAPHPNNAAAAAATRALQGRCGEPVRVPEEPAAGGPRAGRPP